MPKVEAYDNSFMSDSVSDLDTTQHAVPSYIDLCISQNVLNLTTMLFLTQVTQVLCEEFMSVT